MSAGDRRGPILLEPQAVGSENGHTTAVNSNKRAADMLRDQLHSGKSSLIDVCHLVDYVSNI